MRRSVFGVRGSRESRSTAGSRGPSFESRAARSRCSFLPQSCLCGLLLPSLPRSRRLRATARGKPKARTAAPRPQGAGGRRYGCGVREPSSQAIAPRGRARRLRRGDRVRRRRRCSSPVLRSPREPRRGGRLPRPQAVPRESLARGALDDDCNRPVRNPLIGDRPGARLMGRGRGPGRRGAPPVSAAPSPSARSRRAGGSRGPAGPARRQ